MTQVSIVIPCFNSAALVAEAVESVRGQSFEDWDLLLINDGSRDDTQAVLERLAQSDRRIHCVDVGSNGGISPARNLGTKLTSGRYLMHMDADDLLTSHALCDHVGALQSADVSYSGYETFGALSAEAVMTDPVPGEELLSMIIDDPGKGAWWRPPGAAMVRREADIRARQRFDVWSRHVPISGESHYFACLFRSGATFASTGKVGIRYRRHAQSDCATASFFGLSLSYLWLLEYWLRELGPVDELIARRAKLLRAIETGARVEAEVAEAG